MSNITTYLGFRHEEHSPGINIFTLRDSTFKTASLKIYFVSDLSPDATRVALLPYILRRGTMRHQTLLELSRALEHLYGTHLSVDVSKLVEWHTVSFRLNVVSDRYVPRRRSLLRPAARILGELINNPVLENAAFLPDYLDQEKRSLKNHIESLNQIR